MKFLFCLMSMIVVVYMGATHANERRIGDSESASGPLDIGRLISKDRADQLRSLIRGPHKQTATADEYALFLLPVVLPPGYYPQGFFRMTNLGDTDDTVSISISDDAGNLSWQVEVDVPYGESRHVNSDDLAGWGTKPGVRITHTLREPSDLDYWGLAESGPDISISAFTRSPDGFINDVGTMALPSKQDDGEWRSKLATANPGSNRSIVGIVRYLNLDTDYSIDLDLWAYDDSGVRSGVAYCTVGPGAALFVQVQDLENGTAQGCSGEWGRGKGKWEVHAESDDLHFAMSFLYSVELGILANVTNAEVYKALFD